MEMLRVIVWGKFSPGLHCPEDISVGRGFSRGGGAKYLGVIKKRSEIKFKKISFFQLKVEHSFTVKRRNMTR